MGEESRLTVHFVLPSVTFVQGKTYSCAYTCGNYIVSAHTFMFFFMETGKVKVAIRPNLLLTCKQVTLPGLLCCTNVWAT